MVLRVKSDSEPGLQRPISRRYLPPSAVLQAHRAVQELMK